MSGNICLILDIFTFLWPITSRPDLLTPSMAILILNFFASFGEIKFDFKDLVRCVNFFCLSKKIFFLSDWTKLYCIPREDNLWSALSALNVKRYSALEVNIRYGSDTPLVIKSSIITPMYEFDLSKISWFCFFIFRAALAPAIKPWAAASS